MILELNNSFYSFELSATNLTKNAPIRSGSYLGVRFYPDKPGKADLVLDSRVVIRERETWDVGDIIEIKGIRSDTREVVFYYIGTIKEK